MPTYTYVKIYTDDWQQSKTELTPFYDTGQSEHDSLVYHMSEDSGLGRATPPRRAPSPGMARHLPSPSGPGSLPPGLFSKRRPGGFDDAASDISTTSSTMDYYGECRINVLMVS